MSERAKRFIRGAGGDDTPTPHVPTEDINSLRSKAFARVMDLVSEGEVEGLVSGLKSVFLDDVPVMNDDGTLNFRNITVWEQKGTQSQAYIPGFPSSEVPVQVSTRLFFGHPLTRSITQPDVNYSVITVGIPILSETDLANGDLHPFAVSYLIEMQNNGGGFVSVEQIDVGGKTTSRYQRSTRIELPSPGPWDIRLTRLSADEVSQARQNETWWDQYSEGIDQRLTYPNSAIIAITIDAQQFKQVPKRGYLMKGVKVKVPTNYDPATRVYTGNWDGTFKVAWTNNPAWCFYDMATNTRYGLGNYIDSAKIDKWTLFTIGKYCDELVPDGFGGMEPRFSCNLYIQSQEDAITLMQQMASIFRGMVYWSQGQVTATQDAPGDAQHLFTAANVREGLFAYAGSSRRVRPTIAMVSWNDPTDHYRKHVEYVEDRAGIARYGIVEAQLQAIGCTSRGQAHRVGLWYLYTSRLETDTVSFATALEGYSVRPGQLFKVADQDRAGKRYGGRIKTAEGCGIGSFLPGMFGLSWCREVTIDAPVLFEQGKLYSLDLKLDDGTVQHVNITNQPGVVGSSVPRYMPGLAGMGWNFELQPGSTDKIYFDALLSSIPSGQNNFIITASDLEPQLFRCVSAQLSEDQWVTVTGVEHNPSKFSAVESGTQLEFPIITSLKVAPAAPTLLKLGDFITTFGSGTVITKLTVSWTPPSDNRGLTYDVEYRVAGGNWIVATPRPQAANYIEIDNVVDGREYEVRVRSVLLSGQGSDYLTDTRTVVGKLALPADVLDFTFDGKKFSWTLNTEDDVRVGGGYHLKFHGGTISTWADAASLHDGVLTASPFVSPTTLYGTNTIMIKAVDSSGNESENPVSLVITNANAVLQNVLSDFDRKVALWPGSIDGGVRDPVSNTLKANSTEFMWSDTPKDMWAVDDSVLMFNPAFEEMTYTDFISPTADLVGSRLTIGAAFTGESWTIYFRQNQQLMWEISTDPQMMWLSHPEGMVGAFIPALAGMPWKMDNPNDLGLYWPSLLGQDNEPMWAVGVEAPWVPWPGELTVQNAAYEFEFITGAGPTQGVISALDFIFDVPDVVLTSASQAIASPGGSRLSLGKTLRVVKSVNLTLKHDGVSTGVSAKYLDKDPTLGPLVKVFDATNTPTAGTVDATVTGY